MRTLRFDLESLDAAAAESLGEPGPVRLVVDTPQWQLDELHHDPETVQRRLTELASYRDRPANVLSMSSYTALPSMPDRDDGGRAPLVVAAWERHRRRFSGDFAAAL